MQSFNRGEWEHFLAAPSDSTGPRRNTLKLRPNQRHPGLQVLGSMLALASVLPLTIGSQALAQTAPAAPAAAASAPKDAARKDDDVKQLESVTITAQKRKQSILDVAASVTVIGEETITQNNIQGIKDFFALTPNVNAQEGGGGGPRSTLITMRGIADQGAGGERVAAVSAFGFYVNELSIGNAATDTANPPLYDIQSIEVLRGPQGTYFGRNASGGVINIQTHKPEKNFFGQVDFGLGTQNTVLAAGIINVPISDTLFVRQSIQSQRDTGFVKNVGSGGGNSGIDLTASRTAFRWLASPRTTVDFTVEVNRENQGVAPFVASGQQRKWGQGSIPLDSSFLASAGLYPDSIDTLAFNTPTWTHNTSNTVLGRIEHQFDTMAMTAIVGQTRGRSTFQRDLDRSERDMVDRLGDFTAKSRSAELRFASTGKNKLDWIVGGYAYQDANDFTNTILIKAPIFGWVPGDHANENVIHIRRNGQALFADLTYHASDALSVSFGGRYSRDNDHQYWTDVYTANGQISLANDDGGVMVPGATYYPSGTDFVRTGGKRAQTLGTDGRNSGNDFSPRLAVNYKLSPNSSVYGTVSQGYKSAGVAVNPDSGDQGASGVSQYKKEKLTNIEFGYKGVLFGNTRVEAAVFNMDWTDFQVPYFLNYCRQPDGTLVLADKTATCGTPVPVNSIINAGKARTRGFELSTITQVNENWRVGGSLGLLNAKYLDFANALVDGSPGDATGTPVQGAPKRTGVLFVQWSGGVGNGDVYVRPELNYRSGFNNKVVGQNTPMVFGDYIPARTLLNLRAGYQIGKATFALSAENLLGKKYFTGWMDGVAGRMVDVHPRTAMLRMTVVTD